MAYIEKREGKRGTTWRAQIKRAGAPVISKTFKRKTDAEEWAKKQEVALLEGQHFPERQAQRRTVADAIKRYREEHLPKLGTPKDRALHLSWWENQIGRLHLSAVTPEKVNACLLTLAAEQLPNGKTRAPATLGHYRVAIVHLLTCAHKWGWTSAPQSARIERPKVDNRRVRFLDDDELSRLLEAVAPHEDLNLLVLLALGTGARAGELLTLTWPQIDMKARQIRLTRTKNGDMRTLPIPAQAVPLLAARVRRLDTPLVFPSRKNPLKPIVLRRAWLDALKTAGIDNFRFHDVRHCAASGALK